MAVMAVLVLTVTAISVTPAAVAQNMTGTGNMTTEGTNMTDMNATGSISQVAPQDEQESEGGDVVIEGGDTGSDEEDDEEN